MRGTGSLSAVILCPVPVCLSSTKEQVWLHSQTNERLLQCFPGHMMNNHAATGLNLQPVLSTTASTLLQHPGWMLRQMWVMVLCRVPPAHAPLFGAGVHREPIFSGQEVLKLPRVLMLPVPCSDLPVRKAVKV